MISQRLLHCTGHWSTAGSRTKLIVELHIIFQVLSSGVMQAPTSNTHRSNRQSCGILTWWPLGLLTARWRGNLTKPTIFVWYSITLFLRFGQILVGQFHDYFLLLLVHWVPHNLSDIPPTLQYFSYYLKHFVADLLLLNSKKCSFFPPQTTSSLLPTLLLLMPLDLYRVVYLYFFKHFLGSKKWVDLIDAV